MNMLSRRRFQPSLESLSVRIAPAAMGGLSGATLVTAHAANVGSHVGAKQMDTDSPSSGGSGPVLLGNPTAPPTLNC
jgi:hypothetical protein